MKKFHFSFFVTLFLITGINSVSAVAPSPTLTAPGNEPFVMIEVGQSVQLTGQSDSLKQEGYYQLQGVKADQLDCKFTGGNAATGHAYWNCTGLKPVSVTGTNSEVFLLVGTERSSTIVIQVNEAGSQLMPQVMPEPGTNPEDIVEDTAPVVEGEDHWNIIKVEFSKKLLMNKKTGKNMLKISPTMKYTSADKEEISFKDTYIWHVQCGVSSADGKEIFFDENKTFKPEKPVTLQDGDTVTASTYLEFDKKITKLLRKKATMICSFGFGKPLEYQYLFMQTSNDVVGSYIFSLIGNRWKVKGWNF